MPASAAAPVPGAAAAHPAGPATATWAVGDLQGCADSLDALLERIDDGRARFLFAGDLVNRGPGSARALRRVRALGERAVAVLGNHDLHLLAVHAGLRPAKGGDTLDDVLSAPDRDELIDWLRHRPLAHREAIDGRTHLLVHAGVPPAWTLDDVLREAGEVERALRGPRWAELLAQMYGNQPDRWRPGLRDAERWRLAINALTRMRFVDGDGALDFAAKGPPEAAPPGLHPWFAAPDRRLRDVTVVCGHWSALGLALRGDLVALDTGCVWGRQLTAVRLEDRAVCQVPCVDAVPGGAED